jgi:outer membrane protein OmpA-like peptidoglycan-associated protein
MSEGPFPVGIEEEDTPWVSVSDLMSGLMIVFLCIAVLFMRQQEKSIEQQRSVATTYKQVQGDLSEALVQEFDKAELERWGAEIAGDGLVVRFKDPSTMFTEGDAALTEGFQKILQEFFPQLVHVLSQPAFHDHIREVRVEGHTSSEWILGRGKQLSSDQIYLKNMELSQRRAFSVLAFVLSLNESATVPQKDLQGWMRANGLSSSQLVLDSKTRAEDPIRSRRVEFRVVTDAEDAMKEIVAQIPGAAR